MPLGLVLLQAGSGPELAGARWACLTTIATDSAGCWSRADGWQRGSALSLREQRRTVGMSPTELANAGGTSTGKCFRHWRLARRLPMPWVEVPVRALSTFCLPVGCSPIALSTGDAPTYLQRCRDQQQAGDRRRERHHGSRRQRQGSSFRLSLQPGCHVADPQ